MRGWSWRNHRDDRGSVCVNLKSCSLSVDLVVSFSSSLKQPVFQISMLYAVAVSMFLFLFHFKETVLRCSHNITSSSFSLLLMSAGQLADIFTGFSLCTAC